VYRTHYKGDFDGVPIRAFMSFNPVPANGPSQNVRVNVVHVHGVTEGLVEMKTQIGTNYRLPAGSISVGQMGEPTLTEQRPTFSKFRHKARGRDFALKIETTSVTPHTIQVLDFPDLSPRRLER